ncbi:hypothetical protein nbrc107696_07660 [Gordonia spumicola]|uniref:ER-bound oxygenase mpaB/mpaB'/Rubber oxygenase catalytic domain-containing protein n=1 Tax=Gordonia spumicola TaxID=589161 RepID=A0A7I9V5I5_9ACTN|nr:oxygenase MpaB family protein [Gordonia spumicola]GEE00320.1 hypothetical protein nbrc107696_07660 [Gordonia spumicola]
MTTYFPHLAETVHSQRDRLPAVYGDFDFDAVPERFTTDPAVESALPRRVAAREPFLDDPELVELMKTATFLGDVPADAYAALSASHSMKQLIGMLTRACRHGVDAVADAPAELTAFIDDLEATPDWIDMSLVADGARRARVEAALLSPFITRGAFIATFTNTYAALPMALTGALSGARAAHRVNETTSFFALTAMPGALDRFGPGFEAAAMVRLMHSMVRFHALTKSDKWDAAVYGLPVPQVDQMPAGLIGMYLQAQRVIRDGRTTFTSGERALVEFARYRCFLLGLPEELVPSEPHDIVRAFHGRAAVLRHGFDDETCGRLVRSTMAAYLRPSDSRFDRMADAVERSFSALAFTIAFCGGNRTAAAGMGVELGLSDVARIAATGPFIVGRYLAVRAGNRIPMLRDPIDRYLVRLLAKRLVTYGKPEFTSDAATYTPSV